MSRREATVIDMIIARFKHTRLEGSGGCKQLHFLNFKILSSPPPPHHKQQGYSSFQSTTYKGVNSCFRGSIQLSWIPSWLTLHLKCLARASS